jgi:hypothetical protein
MRGLIAVACVWFALTAAGAASAQTPNISGVWHVNGRAHYGAVWASATPTCTFRQVGGRLSGICVGPAARGPLSGAIAGTRVSWTWSHGATRPDGVSGDTQFNGIYVNSRLIRGSMIAPPVPGSGSFTQTR